MKTLADIGVIDACKSDEQFFARAILCNLKQAYHEDAEALQMLASMLFPFYRYRKPFILIH